MKRTILTLILSGIAIGAYAQEQETAKTGFNFGPLPAIGYSTDLGFHYGALTDIYYYGDGSVYPDYLYKMYFEASAYTKGNKVLHASYDSKHLLPGMRVAGAISYFGNSTYSFYGFNGASALNGDYDRITDKGMGWYLMKRSIFRVTGGLQGKISGNWGWATGISYYDFKVGETENKSIDATMPSLYKAYVDTGIIPEMEKNGGRHLELKAGVVYDTRDHENNPHRGTNMEIYLFGAPALFKNTSPYLNLAFHFKQFYPLGEKVVFGYHLAYQGNLLGSTPFYMLQTIPSINMKQINTEGLGSTSTLRGTTSNRIMADGYAWFNTELRIPFAKFDFIKQHFQLVVNPFIDGGYVVQPYNLDKQKAAADYINTLSSNSSFAEMRDKLSIYDKDMEKNFHMSAGFGLHVIMNQNINVSLEFAKVFLNSIANPTIGDKNFLPKNDGSWGMNVGLNYIF